MLDDPAFASEPASQVKIAPSRLADASEPPVFREIRHIRQSPTPDELHPMRDVELTVALELGRANVPLADVLSLTSGTVIELNKRAGDPVDVVVNNVIVARGEVVVVEDRFAVRITEVLVES